MQVKLEAGLAVGAKVLFVPSANVDKDGCLISVDATGTERVYTDVLVPQETRIVACDHLLDVLDLLWAISGEGGNDALTFLPVSHTIIRLVVVAHHRITYLSPPSVRVCSNNLCWNCVSPSNQS